MFAIRAMVLTAGLIGLSASQGAAQTSVSEPPQVIQLPGITVTTANKRPQRAKAAAPARETSSGPAQSGTTLPPSTVQAEPPVFEDADANVSVRSAEELRATGVEKVADLEKVFPGLTVRSRGNRAYANFTVRGMSSPDFYNPSVQVLIDGVPQSAASMTQDLINVDRVEFLRGPQGVLYGANAFGGVLNIISRQPRENTASASGTVSNLRSGAQAAATGVLIPQTAFLDLALKREWDRGEIDDLLTGKDDIDSGNSFAGRASLRYAPLGGPFDMALTYAYDRVRSHEEFYIRDELLKKREYDLPIPYPFLDRRTQTASASWNYRLGGFTLTSITAFQDVDMTRDLYGYEFPETEKAFSQEMRLAYAGPGPFSGVAGVYIRNSDFSREVSYRADRNEIGTDTLAAFGEITWHATERLDFTSGVRVTRDRSSIDYELPAFLSFSDSAEFHSTQPKISIGYKLNGLTRVYALVSQGYKPGGFQHAIVNPANPADFEAYDPETAWNYEVGFRTSMFRRSFDLSAAIYHIVSDDKQIYVGPVGQQVIRNAGEAESTGIEIEAQWRPTDRLTFRANANYGRSEFTHFIDAGAGVDYSGNRVPYAPDFTAALSARYVFEQRYLGATTALLGGMRYASRTYFDEANSLSQGAFAIYDAAVEFSWDNGLALKLFANNITDEIYREYSYLSGPQVLSLPSEGRMVGMTLSVKY